MKAVQSGGTMIGEIATAYRIQNDPGPMAITYQSDEMAAMEAKTRLWPLLERIPGIAKMLPKPGPMRTQQEIFFGGFFLILNSANLAHQQSQSIRFRINEEVWMPKWAEVYPDACARVTAFEQQGTSHILDISQAGFEGDWMDQSWRNGSMEEWSALCPSCGKSHPISFAIRDESGKQIGGVVWDKSAVNEDDTINEARAVETARFRCPHCGAEQDDSDKTRYNWKKSGHYVQTRADAPKHWRSFHWESLVAHPMRALVSEYCQAENQAVRVGDETPRIKFRQKREAKSHRMEKTAVSVINVSASTYTVEDYFEGARKVEGETMRAMTIDRQQTHFWVEVGAWTPAPAYSQLYFGRVDTIDQVRALQLRYAVPDSCVAQDRRYLPSETDKDCARFGWRGLMGVSRKTWTLRNETTDQLENYPHSDPKLSSIGGGAQVYFYEFSGDHMKDILFSALNGKGFRWNLPRNVSPLYLEHLKSEAKKEVRPGVWRYVEVRQNANHGIDTSSMMLAIAVIAGIVRFKLEDTV